VRRPEEIFVFVRRGHEYLALHRSPRQGGYWHCVAGALEEGENFSEAAARELREETCLVAVPVDLNRRYEYEIEGWESHYRPDAGPVVVECFVTDAPDGWEPALDWEHDGYRWCATEEAAILLYWPEAREVLRELAGS
jgi:8-oxo-dGTP pyrophosphatase MutT (NUDIX family)